MNDEEILWLSDGIAYAKADGKSEKDVFNVFLSWIELTNYTKRETAAYVTDYFYFNLTLSRMQLCRYAIRVIFPVLGLLGYFIHIRVLRLKDYREVSFMYHRFLVRISVSCSVFELLQGICNFSSNANPVVGPIIANICLGLANSLNAICESVAVPMSLERAVCLIVPMWFDKINTKTVASVAITISSLTGLWYLPNCFEISPQIINGTLVAAQMPFVNSSAYQTYLRVIGYCGDIRSSALFLLSLLIVAGLIRLQMERKRKKLLISTDKQTMTLSILTMSVAIPAFLINILYTIGSDGYPVEIVGRAALTFTFEQAESLVDSAVAIRADLLAVTFFFLIFNSGHFYLYYFLSRSFRRSTHQVVAEMIKGRSNEVKPVHTGNARKKQSCVIITAENPQQL